MKTLNCRGCTRSASSARWLLPIVLSLTTAGCALSSRPTPPVVVPQVVIPRPPHVSEPRPSGYYWQKHFDLMMKRCLLEQRRQELLNLKVTTCEPS